LRVFLRGGQRQGHEKEITKRHAHEKQAQAAGQPAIDVFPLLHLEGRKDKRGDKVKDERRGQHYAAVEGYLEGHKEPARRAEIDQVNVDALRPLGQRGMVVNLPREHLVGAQKGRGNPDRDGAVGAQGQRALLLRAERERPQPIRAKEDRHHLAAARMRSAGFGERIFEDGNNVIAGNQAKQNAHAQGDDAFDEHPPQVFEVLQERFYRAAFLFLGGIKAFRLGVFRHSWNRSATQAWVPDVEEGVVDGEDSGGDGGVVLAGRRVGGGGEVSSIALEISSVTSRVAFLNSRMPVPSPLASSGSLLAPNNMSTTARIRTISQPPSIPANITFIS